MSNLLCDNSWSSAERPTGPVFRAPNKLPPMDIVASSSKKGSSTRQREDVNMLTGAAAGEPDLLTHRRSRAQSIWQRRVGHEERRRHVTLPKYVGLNKLMRQFCRAHSCDNSDEVGTSPTFEKNAPNGSLRKRNQTLFEYCVIVDWDMSHSKPYVKSVFPPSKEPHANIELLVHPTSVGLQDARNQNFLLILTDGATQVYGFCRRVLPESSQFCIPLTYCLVTKHNESQVFYRLLECIESQHGSGNLPDMLMALFHDQTLPPAGANVSFTLPSAFEFRELAQSEPALPHTLTISRPKDLRLTRTELYDVFHCLGPKGLIEVFESLLLERTVLVCSRHLSLLTSCVQGLQLTLYPLQWQHVIVTVLPDQMLEILDAPVTMLVGTLHDVPKDLWKSGNTCYVHLDKRTIRPSRSKRDSILPRKLKKTLLESLKVVQAFEDNPELSNLLIGDAFVRLFVELFSNLDTNAYDKAQFLARVTDQARQPFLERLLETAMFNDFVAGWQASKSSSVSTQGGCDYSVFQSSIEETSVNGDWSLAGAQEIIAKHRLNQQRNKHFPKKVQRLINNIRERIL